MEHEIECPVNYAAGGRCICGKDKLSSTTTSVADVLPHGEFCSCALCMRIAELEAENQRLRKSLNWALRTIDISDFEDLPVAQDKYAKASALLRE